MRRLPAVLLALAPACPVAAADLPGWEAVATARGVTPDGKSLAFTPDGKAVLTSDLARVDPATGKFDPPPANRADRLIGFTAAGQPVTWWRFRTHPTREPEGAQVLAGGKEFCKVGKGEVTEAAISPDKSLAATASADKLRLWDVKTGKELPLEMREDAVRYYIHALAFSPDGKSLAVGSGTGYPAGNQNGAVAVWDLATRKLIRVLPSPESQVNALAWSPDGKRLAGGGVHSAGVRVWDVAAGKETLLEYKGAGQVFAVAFSPDGKSVASTWRGPGAGDTEAGVVVWDAASGKAQGVLTGPRGAVRAFAFAPEGKRVAALDSYGTVRVWQTK